MLKEFKLNENIRLLQLPKCPFDDGESFPKIDGYNFNEYKEDEYL